MKYEMLTVIVVAVMLLFGGVTVFAHVDCPVIGSGGVATNDGSVFVVGQVVVGKVGTSGELAQGAVPCWFGGVAFGDVNCDGVLDVGDVAEFAEQMGGPSQPIVPPCPPGADLDGDGDGDLADFALLQIASGD